MKIIIAVPVFNEEKILQQNIEKIFLFCQQNLKEEWHIVIADNKSTDRSGEVGQNISKIYSNVSYLFIDQKGKGVAIKQAWKKYDADIYCFMDADLATDLSALPKLITAIKNGADLAIGSRYHQDSKVKRSILRRIFSLGYQIVLKIIIGTKISDAPCGFKAVSDRIKKELLDQVEDNFWFFDSELVLRAEKNKYNIVEVPVAWEEPRRAGKSRVNVLAVSLAYIKKVIALKGKM